MNIKALITLLTAVFLLCLNPAHGKNSDNQIGLKIQQVWHDSHQLETFLGIASIAALNDNDEVEGVSRYVALSRAKEADRKLKKGLRVLAALKPKATHNQKQAIDGIELVAYGRTRALSAILAGPDGGGLTIVTSCSGWWDCIGFSAGCEGAGGKWEDQGAGTETCTI